MIFGAIVLFVSGVALSFYVVLPLAIGWLMGIAANTDALEPMITYREYFSFAVNMSLAFGLCFELPIVILLLATLGIVTPEFLRRYRRHALVLCVVAGALLSPGDLVWTTILLAAPLVPAVRAERGADGDRLPAPAQARRAGRGRGGGAEAKRGRARAAATRDSEPWEERRLVGRVAAGHDAAPAPLVRRWRIGGRRWVGGRSGARVATRRERPGPSRHDGAARHHARCRATRSVRRATRRELVRDRLSPTAPPSFKVDWAEPGLRHGRAAGARGIHDDEVPGRSASSFGPRIARSSWKGRRPSVDRTPCSSATPSSTTTRSTSSPPSAKDSGAGRAPGSDWRAGRHSRETHRVRHARTARQGVRR